MPFGSMLNLEQGNCGNEQGIIGERREKLRAQDDEETEIHGKFGFRYTDRVLYHEFVSEAWQLRRRNRIAALQ